MDKINGVSQIVKLLQSKIGKSKESSRTGKSKTSPNDNTKSTSKSSIEELEIQISTKISQLDNKAANYKHSAINIFVEEILDWEFSNDITSDPEFNKLKEKITAAFTENENLNKGFEKILTQIKS